MSGIWTRVMDIGGMEMEPVDGDFIDRDALTKQEGTGRRAPGRLPEQSAPAEPKRP